MADGDTRGGAKDCVEGFDPREKKPLEKVTAPSRLQELKKEQKQMEVKVKKDLEREQKTMLDMQNKLNDCNKEYADRKRELDELRAVQTQKLTPSDQMQIARLTGRTCDAFLQQRPREDPGMEEKTVDVDVHYLPSMEAGLSLRIGGEGAGSRDAKFPVKLSENVSSLAKRAATYWGLDADKVFFLDRDGRIVFEDMSLREIILPPVHKSSSSSAAASSSAPALGDAGPSRGSASSSNTQLAKFAGALSEDAIELTDPFMEQWTVKGWNYNLTLVRAVRPGEMPLAGNANKPKGEDWHDFTFDPKKLAQDLKDTVAKYGDPEFGDAKVEMEDIPSLFDLIESGKKKKAQKRADTACRAAEFILFFVSFSLFHYLMLPSYNWSTTMRLIADGIEKNLTLFNNAERSYLNIDSYYDIASEQEFQAWVQGPLKRAALAPGLSNNNLYVLGLWGIRYQAMEHEVEPPVAWCPAPSPPATAAGSSAASDVNASAANASNDTNASNSSNISNVSTPAPGSTVATATTQEDCSPDRFRTCLNTRVVEVFTDAEEDGDMVPSCGQIVKSQPLLLWVDSLTSREVFTYLIGEAGAYYGGQKSTILTTNASTFDSTVSALNMQAGDTATTARMILVYVYTPSLNGVLVFQWLVENTHAGRMWATRKMRLVNFSIGAEVTFTVSIVCLVLAFMTFFMELRRILGCPKRCSFEQHRDRCSCWTFVFLLAPLIMLSSFTVFLARYVTATEDTLQLDPDTQFLTDSGSKHLHELYLLDYFNKLLNLLVLVALNVLLFRYFLMFFPQMSYLTAMVAKLVKPLWYSLVFVLLAIVAYSVFLYVMFSARFADFSNLNLSIAQVFKFTQGGVSNWYRLYAEYPTLYTMVTLAGFIVIHLMLNNMALAVMLSHKKEKDLRQNYSYHRFWAAEISKKGNNKEEFNPATIGEREKDSKDQAR